MGRCTRSRTASKEGLVPASNNKPKAVSTSDSEVVEALVQNANILLIGSLGRVSEQPVVGQTEGSCGKEFIPILGGGEGSRLAHQRPDMLLPTWIVEKRETVTRSSLQGDSGAAGRGRKTSFSAVKRASRVWLRL